MAVIKIEDNKTLPPVIKITIGKVVNKINTKQLSKIYK